MNRFFCASFLAAAFLAIACREERAAAPPPSALPRAPGDASTSSTPAPTSAIDAHDADTPEASAADDPCAHGGRLVKKDLTCADRKAWYAALAWPAECEDAYDATAIRGTPALAFYDVGGGHEVAAVACTYGAYQGYSVYMLLAAADGGAPRGTLLSFRAYQAEEHSMTPVTRTEIWGQNEFDPVKKTLAVFNRYRGPGDCGALVTYAFRDGRPVVKEYRSKNSCDGQGRDPAAWPRIKAP